VGSLPAWGYGALALTALYLLTLLTAAAGKTNWFNKTPAIFLAHNLAGAALIAMSGWALMRVRKYGTIIFPIATLAGLLLVGLIPFFFFYRMQKREQGWFAGLVAMYLGLAVLLIMLLNPSSDRQSKEMNRVFFTASHVMVSLCVAYGMTLFGAVMVTQYG